MFAPTRPNLHTGALLVLLLGVAACAPHELHRTDHNLCVRTSVEQECPQSSLQAYRDPANAAGEYTLGFVELDDQGALWSRRQMQSVVTAAEAAATEDLLLVVFVHGWKHSAQAGDENIRTFRDGLRGLSELESALAERTGQAARGVFGVYLGWRGASITAPVLKELTFWDRKNTAHKVGHGGVSEVLGQLEQIKRTKDAIAGGRGRSRTRLVVIGHSFGGAVVYSALSQLLVDRFVRTAGPVGQMSDVDGFGDLVVLINPAFEAVRYTTLSDMANERPPYLPSQLPVTAILTSAADDATGKAFPLGRWLSTFWEKHRVMERPNAVTGETEHIDQEQANVTAIGHFEPYWTHALEASTPAAAGDAPPVGTAQELRQYAEVSGRWDRDSPGNVIDFTGSRLTRSANSVGRNPYLVIRVDGDLIRDHNHIDDPRLLSFIRQLIQLTAQSPDPKVRAEMRSRAAQ